MVNFMIPGMYEHKKLNLQLLHLMESMPELFYNDIHISACYGNFQFCIWDGGRVFKNYKQATKEDIETTIKEYNDLGVPVRQIFTNNMLKPEDYYNRFCNLCLELAQNNFNEIVVADSGLEQYIKEKYPNFIFISSTTKCITDTNALKEELNKDYKYVCLDYNLNHHFKFLETLTEDEKHKCEFLINAICPSGCPNRRNHYRLNSLYYLNYGKPYKVSTCQITTNTISPTAIEYPTNISPEELYNKYVPLGFSHFKLEGRTLSPVEVAANYARYFVKPEYQLYFMSIILE